MRLWKQTVVSLAVLGAAATLWVRNYPEAMAVLERAGIATASVKSALPERGEAPAATGRGEAPVVLGVEVARATINDSVSAIGDGRAARSVTVTPYVSGRVAGIEVASGDFAKAGAPLVRLDSETEEIELDRSRLTLEDARETLARNRELARSNTLSEVQVRVAELAVKQAELAERDAQLALDHRVIRAPFDGWVGILGVDVGDQVGTSTEIATMDDRSRILVDFRVPERFVGKVKVGAPVSARPLARPDLQLTGEVVTLDSRVSADTRTLRVRASLDNSEDVLRAGMAFSIGMRFPGDTFAAVDPLAIQWSADGAYVWIGVDGKAVQVPVRIVQRNNDAVLVDGDLPPGTMVVTQGVQMLRTDAAFRFDDGATPATPATADQRGEAGDARARPSRT